MATAAKPKLQGKTDLSEVLNEAVRAKQAEAVKVRHVETADPRFAAIQANGFFKVMFAENTSPEQKRAEVTKLLTFEGTKEANRVTVTGLRWDWSDRRLTALTKLPANR